MSRSLAEKFGVKPDRIARAIAVPNEVTGLDFIRNEAENPAVIIAFVANADEVAPRLEEALRDYQRGGALWFAYPKKSGKRAGDISRDNGWEIILAHDLLPVTQIAIDDDWSALRFRYRDEIPKITRKTQ